MGNSINVQTGEITTRVKTAEEIAAQAAYMENEYPADCLRRLRNQRNELLAETDYLALSDVTMTDEMRTYRQALRDLPANTADPANPVWPTKPEAS